MALEIVVDKKMNTPVYRQIIEQIMLLVRDQELVSGEKLPPERVLAESLGVARGTVKKAYEKLASNNVIEMVQGRGSFISSGQDVIAANRKDKAVHLINDTLQELDKLNFDFREIRSLFQVLLMEHEQKREMIHVAGIDCNPEALSIFDRQLRHISNVQLYRFLLDDLYRLPDIKQNLAEYDLILTTSTHYAEVIGQLPELREHIIQVVVSPSQQTIIDLAKIPEHANIGIISSSKNFCKIIRDKIKDFQIHPKNITHLLEEQFVKFPKFIEDRQIIITPPKSVLEERRELQIYWQRFLDNGGQIIKFDYQIERGALIHIEESISTLIKNRKGR